MGRLEFTPNGVENKKAKKLSDQRLFFSDSMVLNCESKFSDAYLKGNSKPACFLPRCKFTAEIAGCF